MSNGQRPQNSARKHYLQGFPLGRLERHSKYSFQSPYIYFFKRTISVVEYSSIRILMVNGTMGGVKSKYLQKCQFPTLSESGDSRDSKEALGSRK